MRKYYAEGYCGDSELNFDRYIFMPDLDRSGFHEIRLSRLNELYEKEQFIPYHQYLRTTSWKIKRVEILSRDDFFCQKCRGYETETIKAKNAEGLENEILRWSQLEKIDYTDLNGQRWICELTIPEGVPDKPYTLHIHHKKYILNRLPWDYDNTDLITLCNYCHEEEHVHNDIPIYDERGSLIKDFSGCNRCNGSGFLPQYKKIQNGICFKCGGTGKNILLINKKMSSPPSYL